MLNLKWADSLLIQMLAVGRPTFNLDLLRWEDPPLIWAKLFAESPYKDREEGALVLCLFTLSGPRLY